MVKTDEDSYNGPEFVMLNGQKGETFVVWK